MALDAWIRRHLTTPEILAREVQTAIQAGNLQQARAIVYHWLQGWAANLPANPGREEVLQADLWRSLADVVERTSDQ